MSEKPYEVRVKKILIAPWVLEKILKGEQEPVDSNVPKDMRIINVHWDSYKGEIELLVASSQFEPLSETSIIEEFTPTFTTNLAKFQEEKKDAV